MWASADAQLMSSASQAASCSQPTFATPQPAGDPFGNACGTNDPLPWNITAMSTIMAMSLACDLSRVGTLQFSQALSPATHTWLPSYGAGLMTHHEWSHAGSATSLYSIMPQCNQGATNNSCGPDPLYSVTPAMATTGGYYKQQLIDIDAWYAQQIAAFAKMLSQLPAPNGNTQQSLLDYTMIVCGSELDMGAAHNHDDTPFLIVGGAGSGRIKTGQLVRFPLNLSAPYASPANRPPTNNRYHNDLLVTIAQIMGVSVSAIDGTANAFGATTMPGASFQTTGGASITLNQGPIQEILPT
jgi:hypothetical protein